MQNRKSPWWLWLLPLPIVWWAALLAAGCWSTGDSLPIPLEKLSAAMNEPLSIRWTDASLRCLLLFTMGYAVAAAAAEAGRKTGDGERSTVPQNGEMCFKSREDTGTESIPGKT